MKLESESKRRWFAAEIELDFNASEAAEFALDECGALGTEIDLLGKREIPETVNVVGYFDSRPDENLLRQKLIEALAIYEFGEAELGEIYVREVPDRDWLAEWKKHWKPTITEKFVIAPTWESISETDKKIIRIEPNMAFGTGTHETTRLCLRAIEKYFLPEMSFFDVGTGTGILAIAAAKLSPHSKILACDTDADSIRIARENASLNFFESAMEFYVGSIREDVPAHDFVCANLTADVIVPLLPLLATKTKQVLVLSGILREQETAVTQALSEVGLVNLKIEYDGEWIAIIIER
jgi:ribosomal protein L11 methyltransferase